MHCTCTCKLCTVHVHVHVHKSHTNIFTRVLGVANRMISRNVALFSLFIYCTISFLPTKSSCFLVVCSTSAILALSEINTVHDDSTFSCSLNKFSQPLNKKHGKTWHIKNFGGIFTESTVRSRKLSHITWS